MRKALIALLVISLLSWLAPGARAQSVGEVFRKVQPFGGRDPCQGAGRVGISRLVRFNEIGSGVIISADGQVMTAAHVVMPWTRSRSRPSAGSPSGHASSRRSRRPIWRF